MGLGYSSELGKESLLEETRIQLDRSLQLLRSNDPETTALDVCDCGIGPKGVEMGGRALSNNTVLTQLNLGYNQLGPKGALALVDSLQQNHSLTALNLAGNYIGDEGAAHLAQWLRTDPPLEELVLFNNDITDKGMLEIVNALLLNSHLIFLNLSMNRVTQKVLIMLQQLLKVNNTLSHLSLQGNPINVEADPNKYSQAEAAVRQALASNEERVTKQKHVEDIKAQKALRRQQKEATERQTKAERDREEALRIEEGMKLRDEQQRREAAEVQQLENEIQRRHQQEAAKKAASDPEVRAAKAQQWCQHAIEQAYAWREKLTLHGTFVKEWRNGFTVMKTRPGDAPGTSPEISSEIPRRLKACWCDPQDTTAPYAKTLHYHCKYEKEGEALATAKPDAEGGLKYQGCRGTGHTCASIGFYAKPLPNLSAANFFASPHPEPIETATSN